MRSLLAARLVLLDSDAARREDLAKALSAFDSFEVLSIATVSEIAAVTGAAPDVFIIEGLSLAANDEAGSIAANPFAASGVPTVLLIPAATSEQRRKAIRAGYSVVLGAPVPPRLLYRRIAHVLQNARRAKRRAQLAAARPKPKPPLIEVAPVELAPRANASAL
jgi:DNA-binding NarL/FixJ family response regulator